MQNKQPYIDFIIDCFGKGIVERGEVMAKFGEVWQTPPRTFDRYFQKAKEQHSEQRETINNAKLNTTIELEKEAVKDANFYRNKILAKMEEIMEQKAKRVEGQVIMPTYSDVIRAGERIAKIMGVDAPTKSENINTNIDKTPIFGDIDLDE